MSKKDWFYVENQKTAVIFLLIAAVLWSTGGLFVKYIKWDAMSIAGARGFVSMFTIWLLVPKARVISFDKYLWLASFCYAFLCMSFINATKLTSAANAIFLQYTAPVFVAIFSAVVLKKKIQKLDFWVIVITLCGMALFFLGDFSYSSLLGNLLGICSGIFFAVMIIAFSFIRNLEPSMVILYGNVLTFLLSLPFMNFPLPDNQSLLAICFLGVFQLGIPYIMYSRAVVKVTPLESIIIPTVEPVLNPIWVFFLLGERPSNFAILGGFIVVSIITFYCIKKLKQA